MNQNKHHSVSLLESHGKTMPYISKEDMYVYCSFHVTAVVCTCGLYAVVNKLTKCLITGCKQKKDKTLWIEIMSMYKRRRKKFNKINSASTRTMLINRT